MLATWGQSGRRESMAQQGFEQTTALLAAPSLAVEHWQEEPAVPSLVRSPPQQQPEVALRFPVQRPRQHQGRWQ